MKPTPLEVLVKNVINFDVDDFRKFAKFLSWEDSRIATGMLVMRYYCLTGEIPK